MQSTAYGKVVTTALGYHDAIDAATAALKDEGFGVLCEIDVAKTLTEKLHVEAEPYRILGVCNAQIAHQALSLEPQLGLLLPCNVVVQVQNGRTVVSAIDARALLGIVGNEHVLSLADDVNAHLHRVLDRVAQM